jgi:hypothetical protein
MTNPHADPVFPDFVFDRLTEVEREGGYLLAGQLIVNQPKRPKLKAATSASSARSSSSLPTGRSRDPRPTTPGSSAGAASPPECDR